METTPVEGPPDSEETKDVSPDQASSPARHIDKDLMARALFMSRGASPPRDQSTGEQLNETPEEAAQRRLNMVSSLMSGKKGGSYFFEFSLSFCN